MKLYQLLKQIEAAIEVATWSPMLMPEPVQNDARGYSGVAPGWVFNVVSFEIESQGFPPGSRGYDGAASNTSGVSVRLTRELAEKAFRLAEGADRR